MNKRLLITTTLSALVLAAGIALPSVAQACPTGHCQQQHHQPPPPPRPPHGHNHKPPKPHHPPTIQITVSEWQWVSVPQYGWVFDWQCWQWKWVRTGMTWDWRQVTKTYTAVWSSEHDCYHYTDSSGTRRRHHVQVPARRS